jgi:thiaminase
MMTLQKKYFKKPKLIHNLWTSYDNNTYYPTCSKGTYEVPKLDAEKFINIRPYCTGMNDIQKISNYSGIDEKEIEKMLASLDRIGLIREEEYSEESKEVINKKLYDACILWASQLEHSNIFNLLVNGDLPVKVLKGVLLENYHYIKDFPEVIKLAHLNETDGHLKALFYEYYEQEIGHEKFVLTSLKKLGLTENEVEYSIPLVSTQNIINLMSSLVSQYPIAILFISKIIEVDEYDEKAVDNFKLKISDKYKIPYKSLDAFFKHGEIDFKLGHSKLLDNNIEHINLKDEKTAGYILNALHDIKHAFDLQKLEMLDYYQTKGNYFPRQKVDFFGV